MHEVMLIFIREGEERTSKLHLNCAVNEAIQIALVQVRLRTEVLRPSSSTQLGFELMTSSS